MIELIYGAKGSGKTKKLIDGANLKVGTSKGNVIFISDKAKYSLDIDRGIRFIVTNEYEVSGEEAFLAFIKGVLASNADITNIFIDGIARILSIEPDKMDKFMQSLESVSDLRKADFTITVSTDELPKFMKRYI